ncbi:MAG: hypothetical protein AMJ79_08235 [Phycisphaerae bacterium SM23_30]|nr:MAG: hypothetical protein AMJ79_08235 [Phycisphaerae bacterium SM23_30]
MDASKFPIKSLKCVFVPQSCFQRQIFFFCLIILFLLVPCGADIPPEYSSFHRVQRIDYQPDPDDLMRIWTVYVGQGDGLLIQLPARCNYDPVPDDDDLSRTEAVDVLIDGGSFNQENETLMEEFLLELYDEPLIEHAVITHHDKDHIKGFTHILTEDSVGVESIYHNGLASYRRGKRGFSNSTTYKQAVIERRNNQLVRGMAFLDPDDDGLGKKLRDDYLIDTKADLIERLGDEEFQGIYEDLAGAVAEEETPIEVGLFERCKANGPFIIERERELDRGVDTTDIDFRLIWPLERAREFGDWGETINGNSVTFRLDYGDFSMLFPGDHNEKSEEKLMQHLEERGELDLLEVDVLKLPHHGSAHAYRPFFRREGTDGRDILPVLSVASMGTRGFTPSWRHPNPTVISWLGGSHRVYHTLIHEKRFKWANLVTQSARRKMHEFSHILIETDGKWFRIVEVDEDENPNFPPTVRETRRGDGTRWIRAR